MRAVLRSPRPISTSACACPSFPDSDIGTADALRLVHEKIYVRWVAMGREGSVLALTGLSCLFLCPLPPHPPPPPDGLYCAQLRPHHQHPASLACGRPSPQRCQCMCPDWLRDFRRGGHMYAVRPHDPFPHSPPPFLLNCRSLFSSTRARPSKLFGSLGSNATKCASLPLFSSFPTLPAPRLTSQPRHAPRTRVSLM